MSSFLNYFLLFFIYSILGWVIETSYIFITTRKFVNRGFLLGPYCPIYGCGSIIVILYLTQYKDNILTVFIMSMVLCSILEYVTSYLLEKIFKARWWDYSKRKFNLNGRICGENTLLFGCASIIVLYVVNPLIIDLVDGISDEVILILSGIGLFMFICDTIISCNVINGLKRTVDNLAVKDSTTEIKKLVKYTLKNGHKIKILQHRLISAFPQLTFDNFINMQKIKTILKSDKKKNSCK